MERFKSWRHAVSVFVSVLLSLLGILTGKSLALPGEGIGTQQPTEVAQTCPPYTKLQSYSRVTTRDGDPVNVRATPNGRIIGSIPNGWAIVPVQKDRSGNWIKVTHHYGDFEPAFGSAPDFANGWVAARFLKPLGKFCEKPMLQSSLLQSRYLAQQAIQIPTQWIKMGDRIARQRQS